MFADDVDRLTWEQDWANAHNEDPYGDSDRQTYDYVELDADHGPPPVVGSGTSGFEAESRPTRQEAEQDGQAQEEV